MADFDVIPVGVRSFLDAIVKRSPNGEKVLVQYHPNGDWAVFDKPPAGDEPGESQEGK